jgi:hypothetical protein
MRKASGAIGNFFCLRFCRYSLSSSAIETDSGTKRDLWNLESGMWVRSEKACVAGGESPPSSAARPPEFRTKEMNGKV